VSPLKESATEYRHLHPNHLYPGQRRSINLNERLTPGRLQI
jgi:hypothetical protein